MARTINSMIELSLSPPKRCARGARPLFSVAVVASVAEDLRAVRQLLETGHASARGVGLAERVAYFFLRRSRGSARSLYLQLLLASRSIAERPIASS